MNYYTRLNNKPTTKNTKITHYYHALGDSLALSLHECQKKHPNAYLVVAQDGAKAQQLARTLAWYAQKQYPVYLFPNWELLPYDHFSPHQDLIATRLELLYQLSSQNTYTLVTSVETLMQKVPPKHFVHQHCLVYRVGDTMALEALRLALSDAGYHMVSQVMEHGEYAVRGAIIDIFPTGSPHPYRIELFDDEIVALKAFDPETQLSHAGQTQIRILPAKEYPKHPQAMCDFYARWREAFPKSNDCHTLQIIQSGNTVPGMEQYQPLFFDDMPTLLDYLPPASTVVYDETLHNKSTEFWETLNHRYDQCSIDHHRPALKPSHLYLSTERLLHQIKSQHNIAIKRKSDDPTSDEFTPLPELMIQHKAKEPLCLLQQQLNTHRALIMFASKGRAKAFMTVCDQQSMAHRWYDSWEAFASDTCELGITVAPCEEGYVLSDHKLCVIPENMLIGIQSKLDADTDDQGHASAANLSTFSLSNLIPGDAIVHVDHGVGRYQGLCTKQLGNTTHEFIKITYAENGILYVPVHYVHLVHPYSAIAIEHPPLHQLGSKKWQKQKEKAQRKLFDTASELLERQAKRHLQHCPPMKLITKDIECFDTEFIHELTEDQKNCNASIQKDLTRSTPMNRLVCGDVGFGKTEVAMRAALIAISNQCQVSVLVPTTVLAEQHYHTFCDRFATWELNIACLSSLRTPKQQQAIKTGLINGNIDIVIGTHSLLQNSVAYHKLGLLIIDEEHRFGVRQKSILKNYQANTHTLMLTATPIPRTLQHAFNDLSDLSIIASPPKKRRAIKTVQCEFQRHIIQDAIQRELMRGGQVYFLHNQVDSMPQMLKRLQDMAPQASIQIAHGQMPKRQLESIMTDFYQQRFSVLLCTTIIESGIDNPNANTIIINRADRLGMAQLHQLRGRVGRSHHQAFAYLMHNAEKLPADAAKRLEAICEHNTLGAGFQLAAHDLEIRGAGELLGDEQSGHLETMGTALYHELLNKTIETLKTNPELKEPTLTEQACEVELSRTALIPSDYINDVHTRLILYKRLAHAPSPEAIDTIEQEMIDRFGVLPEAAWLYVASCRLKHMAKRTRVQSIKIFGPQITLKFAGQPALDLQAIIALIQSSPKQYALRGTDAMIIQSTAEKPIDHVKFAYQFLDKYQQRS